MDIEPIHVLPADELEHLLSITQEGVEFLKVRVKPELPKALYFLIDSVKKSLVFFFPEHADLIAKITDTKVAIKAMRKAQKFYPLAEGVEALSKIYDVIFNYETPKAFYEMEEAVHEWEEAAEEMERSVKEMELTVKEYARIASYYFLESLDQENKKLGLKKKKLERKIRTDASYTKEGKRMEEVRGKPRDKKNKILLEVLRQKMSGRSWESAEQLMQSFPEIDNPLSIDGCKIYKKVLKGNWKVIMIEPDRKFNKWGLRAVSNYYKKVKNE
jgi:hypothetical protein